MAFTPTLGNTDPTQIWKEAEMASIGATVQVPDEDPAPQNILVQTENAPPPDVGSAQMEVTAAEATITEMRAAIAAASNRNIPESEPTLPSLSTLGNPQDVIAQAQAAKDIASRVKTSTEAAILQHDLAKFGTEAFQALSASVAPIGGTILRSMNTLFMANADGSQYDAALANDGKKPEIPIQNLTESYVARTTTYMPITGLPAIGQGQGAGRVG